MNAPEPDEIEIELPDDSITQGFTLHSVSPELFHHYLTGHTEGGRAGFQIAEVHIASPFSRWYRLEDDDGNDAWIHMLQFLIDEIFLNVTEPLEEPVSTWLRRLWKRNVRAKRGREPVIVEGLGAMPIPNENGATWDDLFDWWYRGGRLQYPTVKDLASAIGKAPGTVSNNHMHYKEQHGRAPRRAA